MESHQDFQNLKAKFQGLQAGFNELPKKPPPLKGSQLPGLGRTHTVSESSSPSGAPAANQRGPPWQGQGAPPSPWLPKPGRGSQASTRTKEAPREQQPLWKVVGNAGKKASSPPSPLGSPKTPRKEQGLSVPCRRPLPPLRTLGPQPPKPPPPTRQPAFRTVQEDRDHPQSGYRNPDEIYDDVEPSPCPPGPKRRDDLLVAERTLRDFQQPGLQPWNSWKPSKEAKKEDISKSLKPPNPLKPYEEKAEREFRKKFKFDGEIVTLTRMMIDPNANTRRAGGRNLAIRRGEILDVIQFTSREQILCRDVNGKYGFVPRKVLLPLETEIYDDVSF